MPLCNPEACVECGAGSGGGSLCSWRRVFHGAWAASMLRIHNICVDWLLCKVHQRVCSPTSRPGGAPAAIAPGADGRHLFTRREQCPPVRCDSLAFCAPASAIPGVHSCCAGELRSGQARTAACRAGRGCHETQAISLMPSMAAFYSPNAPGLPPPSPPSAPPRQPASFPSSLPACRRAQPQVRLISAQLSLDTPSDGGAATAA